MAYLTPTISVTQNFPFQQLAQVTSLSTASTGPVGFGSSLFLQRMFLPGELALTEVDLAFGISFPGTSQGQGTLARSLIVYSLANSTSLAALTTMTGTSTTTVSVSGTSSWMTGVNTNAGSAATRFQGGWAGSVLAAMTFASSVLQPGDYVFGNMFEFKQASSAWTVSLFGASAAAITSSAGAFLSSAGLASGSVFATTSLTSALITAFSTSSLATANVLSNSGLAAATVFTLPSAANVLSTSGIQQLTLAIASVTTTGSGVSTVSVVNKITADLAEYVLSATAPASVLSSAGLDAGSVFLSSLGTSAANVISNSGTRTLSLLSASGLAAGSVFTAPAAASAVMGVGLSSLPTFSYFGTSSASGAFPSAFIAGLLSTSALPTSVALTTGVLTLWTFGGAGTSGGCIQPWFCLVGS